MPRSSARRLARRLGVENEDVVVLRYHGRSVRIPVWIMPGQADGSITVSLGHGRRRAGRVGTGVGVDVYGLRTSEEPWFGGRGLKSSRRANGAAWRPCIAISAWKVAT